MLVVLGMSHKVAPIGVREAFAVPGDSLGSLNQRIVASANVAEAMVLSTCNRVELYSVAQSERSVADELKTVFGAERGLDSNLVKKYSYVLEGEAAVRHLMRVCASLDSMVVGEAQILGQVKEAAARAREVGTVGPILDRVLGAAFHAAKKVRTETGIARSTVSIGSVAVDLAKRIFPRLDDCRVLVVGAGKMGQVTARSLASAGVARVYATSRTYARAAQLAERYGWLARDFSELDDLLSTIDVVLSCTGAERPILDVARVRRVIKRRKYRPLFLVDIAVPRDITPGVGELDTVYLYNIDDLEAIAAENLANRRRESADAEAIVEEAVKTLGQWQKALRVKPLIAAIRQNADALVEAELGKAFGRRLSHLGDSDRQAVGAVVKAVTNKLLHPTMAALRDEASGDGGLALASAAQRLHGVGVPRAGEEE